MDFDSWTNRKADKERARRLVVGYVIGIITIGSMGTALALSSSAPAVPEEESTKEEVMDVQLAEEPEPMDDPEPEPEPEPVEPDAEPTPADQLQQGPVMPTLETPTEVPDDAPEESDVDPNANPYAGTDPYKFAGQGGTAKRRTVKKVVKQAAEPEPKPAAPSGPVRITAGTDPPKKLSSPGTSYPVAAKAAGIEGTVIVKFVVTKQGNTTQIQSVRGPDALRPACEATVQGTKYSPAMRNGQPVSVYKTKRCVFRLET